MQPAGNKGQERTLGLHSFSLCQDGEETLGWWVEEGWETGSTLPHSKHPQEGSAETSPRSLDQQ